jgi:hypothetical protein
VSSTCGDGNACTLDACDPTSGLCTNTDTVSSTCNDGNTCTDDACDPGTGLCTNTDNGSCGLEICRTPGFWATHAGTEKGEGKSKNLTQKVIDEVGCMVICGERITNTALDSANSAEEALCVSVAGNSILQLARQLTAAALNCIVTNGNADCSGVSVEGLFQGCNAVCADGDLTFGGIDCIEALDCFNNGGTFDPITGLCPKSEINCHDSTEVGFCQSGPDKNKLCSTNAECASGAACKPGPAGSSDRCNTAHANLCSIVPFTAPSGRSSESQCTNGLKQLAAETCP